MFFFRSPLWRLISFAFTIAIVVFVYLGPIKDATKEATEATKAAGELTRAPNAREDLYRGANFERALAKLRAKEGARVKLLEISVRPADAEFQIRDGEKAHGYRYDAKTRELVPEAVDVVGPGSLQGSDFSLEQVPAGITKKLARRVRREDGSLRATNMRLSRALTRGRLAWTINAEGGGRTGIVYQANPNGTRFGTPVEFATG